MLSIIIVHWNTPELLADCLASVEPELACFGAEDEVVVVDCASPGEGHRRELERFPDVRLIQMDVNRGYAAGCNAGVAATGGDIVLLLNADTFLQPGALEALTRTFDLAPHIGMVAPLLLNPDGTVQSAGYRFPGIANVLCDLLPVPARLFASGLNGRFRPGDGRRPYSVDYALGAALAIRRAAFDSAQGFDEHYGMYSEEVDFARRLDAGGWTRLIAPAARIVHVGGASTGQIPREMQAALWRSRGRYLRRWESPVRQRLITAAINLSCALRSRTSDPEEAERHRAIRAAFHEGLRCPA